MAPRSSFHAILLSLFLVGVVRADDTGCCSPPSPPPPLVGGSGSGRSLVSVPVRVPTSTVDRVLTSLLPSLPGRYGGRVPVVAPTSTLGHVLTTLLPPGGRPGFSPSVGVGTSQEVGSILSNYLPPPPGGYSFSANPGGLIISIPTLLPPVATSPASGELTTHLTSILPVTVAPCLASQYISNTVVTSLYISTVSYVTTQTIIQTVAQTFTETCLSPSTTSIPGGLSTCVTGTPIITGAYTLTYSEVVPTIYLPNYLPDLSWETGAGHLIAYQVCSSHIRSL